MIDGIANYAGDIETEARCNQATALLDRAINEIAKKTEHSAEPSLLNVMLQSCLLYTSPSPRDRTRSRMPSSA